MYREQAIVRLEAIHKREDGDQEDWHWEADRVLCELLISLGYEDVVTKWSAIPKWYA